MSRSVIDQKEHAFDGKQRKEDQRIWAAYVAEGIGTFGLVFAGCGAIMIDTLTHGQISHVGVSLVFGLIIMVMIYAFGHISGAHFNPAVTLAFALVRHFPWRRVPGYWAVQVLGAILAAACLRLLLGNVAYLGATLPAGNGGAWQSCGLEFFLTFFLMLVIAAMATDSRAVGQAAALAIGGTVALDALFAGPITGASMNPARSFGPALVDWQWTAQWVYVLGPMLGAVAGALTYRLLCGKQQRGGKRASNPRACPLFRQYLMDKRAETDCHTLMQDYF